MRQGFAGRFDTFDLTKHFCLNKRSPRTISVNTYPTTVDHLAVYSGRDLLIFSFECDESIGGSHLLVIGIFTLNREFDVPSVFD